MTIVTTLPYASARKNTADYIRQSEFLLGGARELPGFVDAWLPRPERFNADKTVWTSESGLNTWAASSGSSHTAINLGTDGVMPYIEFLAPGENADGYETSSIAGVDWSQDLTFVMPFKIAKDHPTFDYNTFGDLASSAKVLTGIGGTQNWNGMRFVTDSNEAFYAANAAGPDSYALYRDLETVRQWNFAVTEYDASAGTVLAAVNGFGADFNVGGNGAVAGATSQAPTGGVIQLNASNLPFKMGGLWAFNGLLSDAANAATRSAFTRLLGALCDNANAQT